MPMDRTDQGKTRDRPKKQNPPSLPSSILSRRPSMSTASAEGGQRLKQNKVQNNTNGRNQPPPRLTSIQVV